LKLDVEPRAGFKPEVEKDLPIDARSVNRMIVSGLELKI